LVITANAAAAQYEPVGCGEQDFEEDEQVEQVARQERPVQAHCQELQQRVERLSRPVPARDRIDERGGRDDGRKRQHHRRQAIHDQHDAVRRRPVAYRVHADALRPDVRRGVAREVEQHRRDRQLDQHR
jgi:hypothetical protein